MAKRFSSSRKIKDFGRIDPPASFSRWLIRYVLCLCFLFYVGFVQPRCDPAQVSKIIMSDVHAVHIHNKQKHAYIAGQGSAGSLQGSILNPR